MEHDRWVPVGPAAEVAGPPWPCHDVAGMALRLVRTPDGDVVAVGAACPHLGAPLTHAEVTSERVVCVHHFYEFALTDGRNLFPGWEEAQLAVFPSRVVDGVVEVRVAAEPGR